MDAFVIASDGFAVLLEDGKFVLNSRYIAPDMAGIAILRDQFERDLLSAPGDQQRNMGCLHAFGLIDRATYPVIFAFKDGLFLAPHAEHDLDNFA